MDVDDDEDSWYQEGDQLNYVIDVVVFGVLLSPVPQC